MGTKENSYEVFISFKHTEADGRETKDFHIASEVYEFLTARGLRVFFSSETFKRLGISEYKQKIDDILDETRVLIVVGTSREHLDAKWVRYEWDSFCSDILDGIKPDGKIFNYIDDMPLSELPRALWRCQSFERSDRSLEQLCRYVFNALGKNNPSALARPGGKYTLIGYNDLKRLGWEFAVTVGRLMDIVYSTLDIEDTSSILDTEGSVKIMERSSDTWRILLGPNDSIIGHWFFVSLYDKEFELLKRGELKEGDISYRNIDYLDLPGHYKGYFCQIDIVKEYRNARTLQLLIISFLKQLEVLAESGIFITEWCVEALSPEGISLSRSMGLSYVGQGSDGGDIYAGSASLMFERPIFQRVPNLIRLYQVEWNRQHSEAEVR